MPVPRLQLVHSWWGIIWNFCSSSFSCIFCFNHCAFSLAIFKISLSIAFCVFVCGWLWACSCSGIFYRFRYEIMSTTITKIAIVRIVLFVSSAGVGSSPQYHHPAAAPAARAGYTRNGIGFFFTNCRLRRLCWSVCLVDWLFVLLRFDRLSLRPSVSSFRLFSVRLGYLFCSL